jgi:hypothetical protein
MCLCFSPIKTEGCGKCKEGEIDKFGTLKDGFKVAAGRSNNEQTFFYGK